MTVNHGADPNDRWIGREIGGRYRVLSKIGEGGMGAVYKAEQISLKRTVALKVLKPDLVSTPLLLRRFNAEAEAVAKLNHPNTVGIYDFGQDPDGTLFIAMEFVEGKSLRKIVTNEAPLAPGRALYIAAQIAASLSDAHSNGIVHRDLKPDNVMLQDRGKHRDIARVLDFGIAKLRDDSRNTAMTQAGDVLGTPQYMSPEQIKGEAVDGRTDVYALAAMLYELLTGRMVFEASTVLSILSKHLVDAPEPPSARRPDLGLTAAVDQLVLAGLAKEPAHRIANMDLFAEMMMQVAANLGVSAAPPRSELVSVVQPAVNTPASLAVPSMYAPGAHRAAALQTPIPVAPSPQPAYQAAPPLLSTTPVIPVPATTGREPYQQPRAQSSKPPWLLGILALALIGGGVGTVLYLKSSSAKKAEVTKDIDGSDSLEPGEPPQAPPSEPGTDHWETSKKAPDLDFRLEGQLFAGANFKLLVPSTFVTGGAEPLLDGSGYTYTWVSPDKGAGMIVVTTSGDVENFDEMASKVGFRNVSTDTETIAGAVRNTGIYKGKLNGVDCIIDGASFNNATSTFGVFIVYKQTDAKRMQDFRNEVLNHRFSW
jgi:serine/threonine protein kinase